MDHRELRNRVWSDGYLQPKTGNGAPTAEGKIGHVYLAVAPSPSPMTSRRPLHAARHGLDLGRGAAEVTIAPSSPPYRSLPAEAVEEAAAVPFLPSLPCCRRSGSQWARPERRPGTARQMVGDGETSGGDDEAGAGRERGGEGKTLDLSALSLSWVLIVWVAAEVVRYLQQQGGRTENWPPVGE
jgi:hypothetical protein